MHRQVPAADVSGTYGLKRHRTMAEWAWVARKTGAPGIRHRAEFQRIARRDKKAFFSDQGKEIEGKKRMGKTEISSRKLEIPREHFMQRWAR